MRALSGAGVAVLSLALAACGSTVPQQSRLTGDQGLGSGEQLSGEQGLGSGSSTAAAAGTTTGGSASATTGGTGGSLPRGATGVATSTTGGGSGTTTGAGSTTSTTGRPSAGPAAVPTGPRITTPVKVGFVETKVGNIGGLGISSGESASPATIFKALVSAVNARGGIAGRKVVPVVAVTDTASGDWNSDFNAACQRLTRDEPVSVVVGYTFTQLDSFESCLAKASVPHLSGSYNIGDEQTLRDFPALVGTNAVTTDRRYRLQLEGAVREGYLKPGNKIGIITDDCPSTRRALKNTVDPYIKANNLNEAARTVITCTAGAGDVGPAVAQVQAAVLSFVSRGVDRVLTEGIPLVLFSSTAEAQGYRPGYIVSSLANGTGIEPNVPKPQQANVHGYGWLPHMDVTRGQQAARTPAQARCLSLHAAGGFVPKDFNDYLFAYSGCDGLFLFEAALTRTGGRTTAAEVISAVTALGTTQPSASLYEGRSSYARRQAPTLYRTWGFSSSCGCFRYTGNPQPLS